tara:strand:+ start:849 stop:1241 length:393 start_codon:yes stop_codon:yes gene_type:complete
MKDKTFKTTQDLAPLMKALYDMKQYQRYNDEDMTYTTNVDGCMGESTIHVRRTPKISNQGQPTVDWALFIDGHHIWAYSGVYINNLDMLDLNTAYEDVKSDKRDKKSKAHDDAKATYKSLFGNCSAHIKS